MYTTLPARLAKQVLEQMNRAGASKLVPDKPKSIEDYDAQVEMGFSRWLDEQAEASELATEDDVQVVMSPHGKPQTMGYVTKDACPGRGDDVEHIPRKSIDKWYYSTG